MKRFKSFNEAAKLDDISVGVKKKKPTGVQADEPLKGYAYNEKMKFKFKGKKTALHIKNNKFLESAEEITEAKADLVKTIEAEIKKYGPKDIDTPTYKQAITLVKKGDMKALKKLIYTSDTEPSEFLSYALAQHDPAAFKKMYPRAKAGDYLRSIVIQHGESVEINEDEQEEKYYLVRVQGKGPAGKDYMNVKTRAHSQKAALEKIRKQYPGNSYSIVKEDYETSISLSIEEIEMNEALSPKEKEKRLQMIKKAVEKLNRANIEKVKKMAMRDMKAAGMFDDVIDEETELDEARLIQVLEILYDYTNQFGKGKLDRAEAKDMLGDWKITQDSVKKIAKQLGGLIEDVVNPPSAALGSKRRVGIIMVSTRKDPKKFDAKKFKAALARDGISVNDIRINQLKEDVIDENQYIGGYRDSSRDGLGPKAKVNAPKLSRIEQLKKQLEFAYKQRDVHDEAYRKYMEQAKAARERNPDDLGAIHGAEARADAQEEMAQKQTMKIQDLKDDIAALRDQMK